jgi:hypothetical protein
MWTFLLALSSAADWTDGTAYVVASELRVRATPSATGKVLGTLSINSPVTTRGGDGDFVRIAAGSGTEGYVAEAFLRRTALTLDEALTQARTTSDLSWWQRAAALDPSSRDALHGLEAAYRSAGRTAEADRVAQQLAWPHEVLIVARSRRVETFGKHDVAVVQWLANGDSHEGRTLPAEDWGAMGIPAQWTVLPDQGAPVSATVREVWAGSHNECSGTFVVEVVLDVPLPEGRVPLAASRGSVPASWRTDGPGPTLPRAAAEAIIEAEAASRGGDGRTVRQGVARVGDRWRGRILSGFSEPGDPWTVVEGWVEGDRFVPDLAKGAGKDFDGFLELGRRDVDGDGAVERILGDRCMTIAAPDGPRREDGPSWEAITDPWCCGC